MNTIEIFGVLLLLLSVILCIKDNILTWPVGIVSNLIYMYIFYDLSVYANVFLQGIFILQSIQGWYNWKYNKLVKITSLDKIGRVQIIIATALLFYIIFFFLLFTDDKSPIFDSITTALSMIAVTLLSFKIIQNWYFWIASDIIFIWFFLKEGLYLSSVTYLIILILAIIGLIKWKKDLKTA